jgi:hypothetical protein
MQLVEAIDLIIDVIKLNNYSDGVAMTVEVLWNDPDLSAEDCRLSRS